MPKENVVINAYDNTNSSYEFGVETYVDNVKVELADRIVQQEVTPTAIKTRLTGGVYSSEPESTKVGTAVSAHYDNLATGSSISFYFTVRNSSGLPIIAVPDVAFYVGGPRNAGGVLWPGGGFGMSNMPVTVYNNWARTNNINSVTQATMLNSSGSLQTIYCYVRFRIILTAGLNDQPGLSTGTS